MECALKRFQVKWMPVHRPEARKGKRFQVKWTPVHRPEARKGKRFQVKWGRFTVRQRGSAGPFPGDADPVGPAGR